jgi:death-on-curing protein
MINCAKYGFDFPWLYLQPLLEEFSTSLRAKHQPAPTNGVGLTFSNHACQGSILCEREVTRLKCNQLGAAGKKVIAHVEESFVSGASHGVQQIVDHFHQYVMINSSGLPLVHALGTLQAAVVRAENKFSYEQSDTFACSAAYAFGLAKAHAFVDGNKRTAFLTSITFLRLNRYQFTTNFTDGLRFMEGIATGEVTEL